MNVDNCSLDREMTSLRHGLQRVDRQIHKELIDQLRVGFNEGRLARQTKYQLDVFMKHLRQHCLDLHDLDVQIQYSRHRRPFAAECQQLPSEVSRSFGRSPYPFEIARKVR